jgi:hypothetical protein
MIMREKIFIVHGRDRSMRETVSEFIKSLGLEPIVLFKETNKGKTIIEKIEECAEDCSYAVVLFSPDDEGRLKGDEKFTYRARQNVILELGYMWGKLGRDKVAILYRENVEKPSDVGGVAYIPYYRKSNWREQLKKELNGAGLLGEQIAMKVEPKPNVNELKPSINESKPSFLDRSQVSFDVRKGFLTPNVRAIFPSPSGNRVAFNSNADQIEETRDDFISEKHELCAKVFPWLYANGSSNGDIILGMLWDYWQKEKANYMS